MKVKLNRQVGENVRDSEVEVSPERGAIMLKDGTARPVAPNAPTSDGMPCGNFPTFPQAMVGMENKLQKPERVRRK